MIKYIYITILLLTSFSTCYSDETKSLTESKAVVPSSKAVKTDEKELAEKKILEAKKDAAEQKELDLAVNRHCANDAKVMECTNMIIGTGLLKCLNDYVEANKSFEYSKQCDLALKKRKKFRITVMSKNTGLKKEMVEP